MSVRLINGDCREVLRTLPDASVQCCVTSPPYFGLRSYLDADDQNKRLEIGSERTPDEYVATLVGVFREVWRVLRNDGVAWINIGDGYASSGPKQLGRNDAGRNFTGGGGNKLGSGNPGKQGVGRTIDYGAKPKDLLGIPWSVAKALQSPYYTGRIKAERDRVWLAAMMDGEGTICGFNHERVDDGRIRTGVNVCITNSSDSLLNECSRIWPASRSEHMRPGEGHLGSKDVDRWLPHGAENKACLLAEIYPYLISKRVQALVGWNLLQFVQSGKRLGKSLQAGEVREKRALLASLLSDLNQGRSYVVPSWCIEPPNCYRDGWYLRSAITWAKPNPMPESCTDRPTNSYEMVFLLAKRPTYFYDADGIAEMAETAAHHAKYHSKKAPANYANKQAEASLAVGRGGQTGIYAQGVTGTRNIRNVWTIATQPFSGAHFATMPPDLAERCIKAGTSEAGACPHCGAPWERIIEKGEPDRGHQIACGGSASDGGYNGTAVKNYSAAKAQNASDVKRRILEGMRTKRTTGWRPTCSCPEHAPVPCVVLDPFAGSGTTGMVADRLGHDAVLIELKQDGLAQDRITRDCPLFAEVVA